MTTDKKNIFGYKFEFDPNIHAQKCGGKKITQPSMGYTIAEMVEASNRGLTVRMDRQLQYPEEEDDHLMDIKDLSDIDILRDGLEQYQTKKIELEKLKKEKTKESQTNDEDKPDETPTTTKEEAK